MLTGRRDVQVLRLHDVEDAALVADTMTHHVTVGADGRVVVGQPLEVPPPEQAPDPVTRAEFDMLLTMVLEG